MLLVIFPLLSAAFVIWRGVWQLPVKKIWHKLLICVPVLLAAFKFQIFHLIGGGKYFSPQLPRWVLLTGAVIFGIHFIFFFLLLIVEVIRLLVRCVLALVKRKLPQGWSKGTIWINPVLLVAAIVFSAVGVSNGVAEPDIVPVEISVANLPAECEGMKIVFLSDLHVDCMSEPDRISKLVTKVNMLNPDLILNGGDFMDGSVETLGEKLLPLRELRAKYGVYGVPGNHEYYSGFNEWMQFLQLKCNIDILLNRSCRVGGLTIAGVGDGAARRKGFRGAGCDFSTAFSGIGKGETVLLLSHRPETAKIAAEFGAALQLSGHTHGGMIRGVDWFIGIPNDGYVSGKYRVGNMALYVSNGSGIWSGFPLRLGRPAEITVITLHRGTGE